MSMKYNPYRPNNVVAPGMFTGRVEELRTIEQCLFQTKHGNPQHFLIQGERGIGKSSLLFFVEKVADGSLALDSVDEKFKFATLSIDLAGVYSQIDIVAAIGRELKRTIGARNSLKQSASKAWDFLSRWEILGVRYHQADQSKADDAQSDLIETFVSLLSDAERELDGVLILMDEADRPDEAAGLGEFCKLFTERLMRRDCNKVVLGIAGLPALITKLRASHESSPRIFETMKLDPLEDEERADVVKRGLEVAYEKNKIKTVIEDDALTMICNLSEGYPHFVQQFSYFSFAEDVDNIITMSDVIRGAYKENGALMQLGSKYFEDMYYARVSSEHYRKVLDTMAKYGDGWVSRKIIISESGIKETTVNNALNTLKSKNVIIIDDSRQGFYRLPTKSFAAWINAVKSVEGRRQFGIAEGSMRM